MDCQTFSYILNGVKVYKAKKSYDTQEDAIKAARFINLMEQNITKQVPYKCKKCQKFHLGRNGKPLTEKYLNKLKQNI